MSGRVTRRKRRSANSAWHEWAICSPVEPGTCRDLRHEKFLGNLQAWVQLFGPFDDVRRADCGCEFLMLPICSDCGGLA
jgi:hypothetical protein